MEKDAEGMYKNLSAIRLIVGMMFKTGKSVIKKKIIEQDAYGFFLIREIVIIINRIIINEDK